MTRRMIFLAIACVAVCTAAAQAHKKEAGHAAGSCVPDHWSWNPQVPGGPQDWAANYPNCNRGQQPPFKPQSPINLDSNAPPSKEFQIKYQPFTAAVENLGYKLVVNVPNRGTNGEGGFIEVDRKRYNLVEFHFHVKSEHTLEGVRYAVEVHLVHEYESNHEDKAAIGILYRLSEEGYNHFVEQVVMAGPLSCSSHRQAVLDIDPRKLFEGDTSKGPYYAYSGSLTTPDCIPITHWLVAKTTSVVNAATYNRLIEIVGAFPNNHGYQYNYRPLQSVDSPVSIWTGTDLPGPRR